METPKSAGEKLTTLLGAVSTLFATLVGVLNLTDRLPPLWPTGEYGFLWLGLALLLISVGIWLLSLGLGSKSRLLQPDRFIIQPDEPRHLMGREEELQELAELCERHLLVFLEGEAGSGKSALIRGGFIAKCRQRKLLQPLYVDLSGAPWEDGLTALLATEAWHSLTEGERAALELKVPPPPSAVFSHLAATAARLGRPTLLIFDQWDDYQNAYRVHFREGPQGNTWITRDTLVRLNSFWAEVNRLVQSEAIRCLFVTRTDNAAGLDTVRFAENRTCRLARVDRNLIAPLLDEITLPGPDGRPVVSHPQRGWGMLKGRLIADVAEDDRVLPVQLSIVLQALHQLSALTVREYERRGGAEGLERLHIERNLAEAARVSGLSVEQVRKVLVAMVEPARAKTLQRRTAELLAVTGQTHPSQQDAADELQKTLECLEGRGILRRRPSGTEGEDLWLLHHDFLCRGVMAAERFANRWHVLLEERANQFREVGGVYRRWRALLPPWQQVRLGLARLAGKFHYAGERRYAVLSTLRFLPYLLLGVAAMLALGGYGYIKDKQQAELLFSAIEGWLSQNAAGDRAGGESFRALAASSERVRWMVLGLAFADEENAGRAKDRMPSLLRLCLGLDPGGERRERLWREIGRPALEKDAGDSVIDLAISTWQEAPREPRDTEFLVGGVVRIGKAKEWSLSYEQAEFFARLAPQMDPASAQTFAGEIISAMKSHASMQGGYQDLQALEKLAKALTPLAPRLSSEQAGRLAELLAAVQGEERKAGETWGLYEHYRRGVLGRLAEPLLAGFPRLDPANAQVFVQAVVNVVKFKVPAGRSAAEAQGDFARVADLLKGLSKSQKAATADRLVRDMLQEDYAFRQASLARGLKLLVGDDEPALQQQAVRRLLTTLDRLTDADGILVLSSALADYAAVLSAEEGRYAVERLLKVAENEKHYASLGLLAQALGILSPWLHENEAQRICTRLVEGAAAQPFGPSFVQGGLNGLPGLAARLTTDQVHGLMTALIGDPLVQATRWPSAGGIVPYLKELAALLGPDQVQAMGRMFEEAVEREKDARRLNVWSELAPALADRLDARQMGKICSRLAEAADLPSRQLVALKAWIAPEVLNRAALRLSDAVGREQISSNQLTKAEALAGLVDRLDAENAQRAAETAVGIFLGSKERDGLILHAAKLPPLDGVIPEPALQALAERVARGIERAASEVELYAYVIKEPEQARNLTAFLRHASDQGLVNILKQPLAVGSVQDVVLRTFEQKYGQHFDDDLWHFLEWARSDSRTGHLDFQSPPQSDFSGE